MSTLLEYERYKDTEIKRWESKRRRMDDRRKYRTIISTEATNTKLGKIVYFVPIIDFGEFRVASHWGDNWTPELVVENGLVTQEELNEIKEEAFQALRFFWKVGTDLKI